MIGTTPSPAGFRRGTLCLPRLQEYEWKCTIRHIKGLTFRVCQFALTLLVIHVISARVESFGMDLAKHSESRGLAKPKGPLTMHSFAPFHIQRLSVSYGLGDVLTDRHPNSLLFTATIANVWARDPHYFLDYEQSENTLLFVHNLSDQWNVGVGFSSRRFGGGILDGFSQNFHDYFGFDQSGRLEVPRYAFHFQVFDESGDLSYQLENSGALNNEQISLFASHKLSVLRSWGLQGKLFGGLSLGIKNHNQIEMYEHDLDFAMGINLSRCWGLRVISYHQVSLVYGSAPSNTLVQLRDFSFGALHAIELQITERTSLILNYLWSSGHVRNLGELSNASHEFNLGLKVMIKPDMLLELALIENMITYDNSPDFGLHMALRYWW